METIRLSESISLPTKNDSIQNSWQRSDSFSKHFEIRTKFSTCTSKDEFNKTSIRNDSKNLMEKHNVTNSSLHDLKPGFKMINTPRKSLNLDYGKGNTSKIAVIQKSSNLRKLSDGNNKKCLSDTASYKSQSTDIKMSANMNSSLNKKIKTCNQNELLGKTIRQSSPFNKTITKNSNLKILKTNLNSDKDNENISKTIIPRKTEIVSEKKSLNLKSSQEYHVQKKINNSKKSRNQILIKNNVGDNMKSVSQCPVTSISEFPSQRFRSPSPYSNISNEKSLKVQEHERNEIQEFPAQIRRSQSPFNQSQHEDNVNVQYELKNNSIREFRNEVNQSQHKENNEIKCNKGNLEREANQIQEFPAQIRRSVSPFTPKTEYVHPKNDDNCESINKIQEFPSQRRQNSNLRKDVSEKMLETENNSFQNYERQKSPILEFPAQRRSPSPNIGYNNNEINKDEIDGEIYQNVIDTKFTKDIVEIKKSQVQDFPAQCRHNLSPIRKITKEVHQNQLKITENRDKSPIQEFPAQRRRSSSPFQTSKQESTSNESEFYQNVNNVKTKIMEREKSPIQEFPAQRRRSFSHDKDISQKIVIDEENSYQSTIKTKEDKSPINEFLVQKSCETNFNTQKVSDEWNTHDEIIQTYRNSLNNKQDQIMTKIGKSPIQEFSSQKRHSPSSYEIQTHDEIIKTYCDTMKIKMSPKNRSNEKLTNNIDLEKNKSLINEFPAQRRHKSPSPCTIRNQEVYNFNNDVNRKQEQNMIQREKSPIQEFPAQRRLNSDDDNEKLQIEKSHNYSECLNNETYFERNQSDNKFVKEQTPIQEFPAQRRSSPNPIQTYESCQVVMDRGLDKNFTKVKNFENLEQRLEILNNVELSSDSNFLIENINGCINKNGKIVEIVSNEIDNRNVDDFNNVNDVHIEKDVTSPSQKNPNIFIRNIKNPGLINDNEFRLREKTPVREFSLQRSSLSPKPSSLSKSKTKEVCIKNKNADNKNCKWNKEKSTSMNVEVRKEIVSKNKEGNQQQQQKNTQNREQKQTYQYQKRPVIESKVITLHQNNLAIHDLKKMSENRCENVSVKKSVKKIPSEKLTTGIVYRRDKSPSLQSCTTAAITVKNSPGEKVGKKHSDFIINKRKQFENKDISKNKSNDLIDNKKTNFLITNAHKVVKKDRPDKNIENAKSEQDVKKKSLNTNSSNIKSPIKEGIVIKKNINKLGLHCGCESLEKHKQTSHYSNLETQCENKGKNDKKTEYVIKITGKLKSPSPVNSNKVDNVKTKLSQQRSQSDIALVKDEQNLQNDCIIEFQYSQTATSINPSDENIFVYPVKNNDSLKNDNRSIDRYPDKIVEPTDDVKNQKAKQSLNKEIYYEESKSKEQDFNSKSIEHNYDEINDMKHLEFLLEKSTDYENRSKIRARIRALKKESASDKKKASVSFLKDVKNVTKSLPSTDYEFGRNNKKTVISKTVTSTFNKGQNDNSTLSSGYGVGPFDNNGLPILGLKALKQPSKVEVEETSIKSEYKSIDDEKKRAQITITSYSQKSSGYDYQNNGNISFQSMNLANMTRNNNINHESFDESKCFGKNSNNTETESVVNNSSNKLIQQSSEKIMDQSNKTFLNNYSKVTGVQDIINRMRNANITEKISNENEKESHEDQEAKALLNKFLGAQILMSSIEPLMNHINTNSMGKKSTNSNNTTINRSHSGTNSLQQKSELNIRHKEVVNTINYDQKKVIRKSVNELMAEQDNPVDVTKTDSESEQNTKTNEMDKNGESLIPLLKELLDSNKVHYMGHRRNSCSRYNSDEDILNGYDNRNQENELKKQVQQQRQDEEQGEQQQVICIEDSGTESGEDLRLLAAGLGSTNRINDDKNNLNFTLLNDVQKALERLRNSLENEQNQQFQNDYEQSELIEFFLNPERKQSLLNLVKRLQETLISSQSKKTQIINNNKQNMRKLRIKRSNTIDISKLNVNKLNVNSVANFEPKNENDKKFLAFIQKHTRNDNVNDNYHVFNDIDDHDFHKRQSLWIKQCNDEQKNHQYYYPYNSNKQKTTNKENYKNWNNIFDNIKTAFEKRSIHQSSNNTINQTIANYNHINNAKMFWKSTEKNSNVIHNNCNINNDNNETNSDNKPKFPWMNKFSNNNNNNNSNVIRIEPPKIINKFSHAPMSAFKPPIKRTRLQNFESSKNIQLYQQRQALEKNRLFLYTPKQTLFHEPKTQTYFNNFNQKTKGNNEITPEYTAISKVMSKPQSLTAVTIKSHNFQNSPKKCDIVNQISSNLQNMHILKSESCHQLAQQRSPENIINKIDSDELSSSPALMQHKNILMKVKSSQYLPKQYEAGGMSKEQLQQKQKTIEAYFSGNNENKSPNIENVKLKSNSVINRVKTSEKLSTQNYRKNGHLLRSNTMPEVNGMKFSDLLDDSLENVEAAFEDLFTSSILLKKN